MNFLIVFAFIFLCLLCISLVIKQIYMSIQWRNLENEVRKINNEPLNRQELLFEYEYLKDRELELRSLEKELFPYLKPKKKNDFYGQN